MLAKLLYETELVFLFYKTSVPSPSSENWQKDKAEIIIGLFS